LIDKAGNSPQQNPIPPTADNLSLKNKKPKHIPTIYSVFGTYTEAVRLINFASPVIQNIFFRLIFKFDSL